MVEYIMGGHLAACGELLRARLAEPAPGRLQLLTGPRQVGKTTLLLEIARELGDQARYVAADGPEAALPGYWPLLWQEVEAVARQQGMAVLMIDEVQHLEDWARRIKGIWDRFRRQRVPVHILLTGSSALRLGKGTNETLAGRFERTTLLHWSANDLAHAFSLPAHDAADALVRWGGYPGAWPLRDDAARWGAYIRDAIIEPAIGLDMLALGTVRKPALLRQVFALAISSPAQIVTLQKLQGQLQDKGALETVAHYLEMLEQAYLVASVRKISATLLRQRNSPPKLVSLNNALATVLHWQKLAQIDEGSQFYGHLVENACLAHAINHGQTVHYWREEPLEVDGVITGSWGEWVVEIKTGPYTLQDLAGLAAFVARFPSYKPLVLCSEAFLNVARSAAIHSMSWQEYLCRETLG